MVRGKAHLSHCQTCRPVSQASFRFHAPGSNFVKCLPHAPGRVWRRRGQRRPMQAVHDPYGALRHRDYRRLLSGSLLYTLGTEMQAVAVGWELYPAHRFGGGTGLRRPGAVPSGAPPRAAGRARRRSLRQAKASDGCPKSRVPDIHWVGGSFLLARAGRAHLFMPFGGRRGPRFQCARPVGALAASRAGRRHPQRRDLEQQRVSDCQRRRSGFGWFGDCQSDPERRLPPHGVVRSSMRGAVQHDPAARDRKAP